MQKSCGVDNGIRQLMKEEDGIGPHCRWRGGESQFAPVYAPALGEQD